MVRKCREVSEMDLGQVGVRTRARAMETPKRSSITVATGTATVTKRRKLNEDGEEELKISSPYIQLRSRRILFRHRELTVDHRTISIEDDDRSRNPISDHDRDLSLSCYSRNRSGAETNKRLEFVDLEDYEVEGEKTKNYNCNKRRDTTTTTPPSSDLEEDLNNMESTANLQEREKEIEIKIKSNEKQRQISDEIEAFFAAEEKEINQKFTEKYNFDFVNEKPLEGRYEWVQLTP